MISFSLKGGREAGPGSSTASRWPPCSCMWRTSVLRAASASSTHRQLTDEQLVSAGSPRHGAALRRHREYQTSSPIWNRLGEGVS
ncbi:MAG: hypothetical protein ACLSHC_10450 [Bilophila wadsworthia]